MTTVQLQRIIGVALLFSVIIGIAMLLIRSADDGAVIDNAQQTSNLGFEPQTAETKLPYVSEAIINLEAAAKNSEELALEQTVTEPNTAPAPAPAPAPEKAPSTAPVAAKAPIPAPVAEKAPIPAKVVQASPTVMWVIQLASFSVKTNADALSLQAKQMGYKSVIENSDSPNGKIYRVRLEPIADKQKAQAVASELNKKMKLSAQVFQE